MDTPEQLAELFIERCGPMHRAYLIDLYRGYVTPADGKVRWGREYIITLARRA
jgi:hypothetical protein